MPWLKTHGSDRMLSSLGLLPEPQADFGATLFPAWPVDKSGIKQSITLNSDHLSGGLLPCYFTGFLVLLPYEEQT